MGIQRIQKLIERIIQPAAHEKKTFCINNCIGQVGFPVWDHSDGGRAQTPPFLLFVCVCVCLPLILANFFVSLQVSLHTPFSRVHTFHVFRLLLSNNQQRSANCHNNAFTGSLCCVPAAPCLSLSRCAFSPPRRGSPSAVSLCCGAHSELALQRQHSPQ